MLPLYEAKMFHHFDARWATYVGTQVHDVTVKQKQDAAFRVQPRYWVAEDLVDEKLPGMWDQPWLLAFRKTARSTDVRSMIPSAIARSAAGDKALLVRALEPLLIQAIFSSFVFDFLVRQKLGGTDLSFFITKQLPVLDPGSFGELCQWDRTVSLRTWVEIRVLRLNSTASDLAATFDHPIVRWDDVERAVLRAELDAAFFILFGISDEDAAYILDSFPIVRRADEAATSSFATKDRILRALHALREAMRTGTPYVSPVENAELRP